MANIQVNELKDGVPPYPAQLPISRQVSSRRIGEVEILTLNRPEKLNALTEDMRAALSGHLSRCSSDPGVKAVVLTGEGDRAFCAGQDFHEVMKFETSDEGGSDTLLAGIEQFYEQIRGFDKPIVAALNGLAVGAGFQITLLCDVRIAHPSVRLGQPEVSSGIPSIVGTYLMSTVLGMSRTADLVLSGRLMNAEEAHGAGVLHEIVEPESVLSRALDRATTLAAQPPLAVATTKAWIRALTEDGLREAFREARKVQRDAHASGEPQAQIANFFAARTTPKS